MTTTFSHFFRGSIWTLVLLVAGHAGYAYPPVFTSGNVRVQLLSASLVRLEAKGPAGFEDRTTFHIVNRDWPGTASSVQTNNGVAEIRTENYVVQVPLNTDSLNDVSVLSPEGKKLYSFDGQLENSKWLPSPGEKMAVWWFADTPRIVPPAWGLSPPPAPMPNGGWDLKNDAPDVYVFVPCGDYFQLRRDFLKLTGPTEMAPLFAFGAFDSRWFDYSEASALKQIDDYRTRSIPLDLLVVDTGWRENASTGYGANTNLFPDLKRFLAEAHAKNVKVMFNDHPEPLGTNEPALDARELDFRFNGLAGLLNDGLDVWWYDRNWSVALVPPAPKLRKEVWGMRLYHDTTARVRPERRPLIMANADGIDHGIRNLPMDVSAHRYPIQWTGDIGPDWEFLRRAVENTVHAGVCSAFPYLSDDLGGHTSDPTTEQYIRWIEHGALSPVYRPHCTHNLKRMPWVFGSEAETIARNLLSLRYRLLPVFYAAARENYETGEPLLRRLDLDFPQFAEAAHDDEYLLGKNLLVAPVLQGGLPDGTAPRVTWIPPGKWINAWNGEIVSGPNTVTNQVPLSQIPIFVKAGAVLLLAPEMRFTGQKPWNPITLDLYPRPDETGLATLYEDDTETVSYRRGEFRKTLIKSWTETKSKTVRVEIGSALGKFSQALEERSWVVRMHLPADWPKNLQSSSVRINGQETSALFREIKQAADAMPLGDPRGAPDGDVFEISLPVAPVSRSQNVEISFGPSR